MEGAHRLVLVDDDIGIRSALRFWAEVEGYELLTFESAEDFLAECSSWLFDSKREDQISNLHVIVDVNLPGMNGPELIARLTPPLNQKQLTIITAKKRDLEGSFGTVQKGVRILEKPFDLEELEQLISQGGDVGLNAATGFADAG